MESDSAGAFYRAIYAPTLSLVTSPDADRVIARNGDLSLDELLRPFSTVPGDLKSRDASGQTHPVSRMRLHFRRQGAKKMTQSEIEARLNKSIEMNITPGPERVRCESAEYCLNVPVGCPWYHHYREIYLHHAPTEKHERLGHYVGTVFVVSSESPAPLDEFTRLANVNRQEKKRLEEAKDDEDDHYWFSDSTQNLFVLVHDAQQGSEAKAQEVHANLKQNFGESCSFLLRLNSNQNGGEKGPDPWNGILQRLDPCRLGPIENIMCGAKDQENIRTFVKDLLVKAVIPHLEREGFKLHEIIQNRKALHRSLFSATRKLFGNNAKSSQVSEKYSETVEVQIRKLADVQFLLQQYHKATENYAYAKREMSNEQNWVEATSAAEMSAIAAFMSQSNRDTFPRQVSSHAINSYLNCSKPHLAVKCALITLEAVRASGGFIDAAKDYLKFVSYDNALLVSLFTEQAALCYLRARFPRQFAFQSVLAGHQFKVAGQRRHSIRNYLNAQEVIADRGWKQAELHINEIIGVHALHLGDSGQAAAQFDRALSLTVGQNPTTLQNYLRMMSKTSSGDKEQKFQLTQYPQVQMQRIQVRLEESKSSRSLSFENSLLEKHVTRIRQLEYECARAASDGIVPIKYKPTFPSKRRSAHTPNTHEIVAHVGEVMVVTIPIYNQLLNTLEMRDIQLLHNNEVDCTIELIDDDASLLLDSKVEQQLVFKVTPSSSGALVFTGLQYALTTPDIDGCETIQLRQEFAIRGPRLTKTQQHKKTVMYGEDKRLRVNVIDQSARLEMTLETPLPSKCLANEIIRLEVTIRNTGNGNASKVWLNHNQAEQMRIGGVERLNGAVHQIEKSSLPGPHLIGDIDAGETKTMKMAMLMTGHGKRLLEMVIYTQEHNDDAMYMPQAAAISVETEIVAPIYFDVKTLPAPVNCKKRALQVEVKTKQQQQQQQADDCGATCRYQLTQALIISKWALSREEKQPLLGLSLAMTKHDVIEHWWMGKMANDNQTCVALQWRGEIISESGLRQCDGLSWVAVSDLVQANAEQSNPPLPLKCYIDAAYRVEHNFATGPARVSCCVTIENTSEQTHVEAIVSFQRMLDSVAGLGECAFVWSGASEKQIKLGPLKKTEVKNVAVFARPGTFDLANFDLAIGELRVKPRTHMIVISDQCT